VWGNEERVKGKATLEPELKLYKIMAAPRVIYEGVSKSFRTDSTMKYTLTTINTR